MQQRMQQCSLLRLATRSRSTAPTATRSSHSTAPTATRSRSTAPTATRSRSTAPTATRSHCPYCALARGTLDSPYCALARSTLNGSYCVLARSTLNSSYSAQLRAAPSTAPTAQLRAAPSTRCTLVQAHLRLLALPHACTSASADYCYTPALLMSQPRGRSTPRTPTAARSRSKLAKTAPGDPACFRKQIPSVSTPSTPTPATTAATHTPELSHCYSRKRPHQTL
jgi:hypothetical protein